MNPNLGLSHHEALEPLLTTHPDAVDFLSIGTKALLVPSARHEATLALTDRFRVAVHDDFLALTASIAFDSLRARRLARLADQCVFEWVAERLDAPPEPVANLLDHVVERVEQLQDFLGAAVLVSNGPAFHGPATAVTTSLAFLSTLAQRTGCGLLLDLDTLCREAPPVIAQSSGPACGESTGDDSSDIDPLIGDLQALDLDAVRGIAVRGLLLDGAIHPPMDAIAERPAALLKRLVADCRRLRGITIGLGEADMATIGAGDLADRLVQMRSALPAHAGVVTFPGASTDGQGAAAPRPRGYLPGHGRGAPMRLVHCMPEAETPPAAGAGEAPPASGA